MIDKFTGEYFFLSNFYKANVIYCGIRYTNNEAAFQSMKVKNDKDRDKFTNLDPSSAKKLGRNIDLREDWEDIKFDIMHQICTNKFNQNEDLKQKLLATGDKYLIEGNNWKDTYWGVYNGVGENNLGIILMNVRENLRRKRNGI